MDGWKREYPEFSQCGLNCLLCPMRLGGYCPGCGGGKGHRPCAMIRCGQERGGVQYCYQCGQFPCERYGTMMEFDSFISHRNMIRDQRRAEEMGIAAYVAQQEEKAALLEQLLEHYNDGRKKSLFCNAVNLLELEDVKRVLSQLEGEHLESGTEKERGARAAELLRQVGARENIPLRRRKKVKNRGELERL